MTVSRLMVAAGAVAILAIAGMAPADAQKTQPRPNARRGQVMAHPLLGRMAQRLSRLDLTPTQKEKVRGFVEAAQATAKTVRENTTLTPEQKRSEMQAITAKLRKNVMDILSEDQKAKLRSAPNGPVTPRPLLARWLVVLEQLDLTQAQKADVKNLMTDAQAKAKIIRESNLEPAEKRLKMREIEKALRAKILSVLTPAQRAKLETMLRQAPGPAQVQ